MEERVVSRAKFPSISLKGDGLHNRFDMLLPDGCLWAEAVWGASFVMSDLDSYRLAVQLGLPLHPGHAGPMYSWSSDHAQTLQ